MNFKNQSPKVLGTRLTIIAFCICMTCAAFFTMRKTADPLARYPYGTLSERQQIIETLNDDQINIMINQQIEPEQILPYVKAPDFEITNTLLYDLASKTQPADPTFIVRFVNLYRDRLDLNNIPQIFSWLSYSDAAGYFDSGSTLPLAATPGSLDEVLDGTSTVYIWRPNDLESVLPGVLLRKEAAQSFWCMDEAALEQGIDLIPISGFIPFENKKSTSDYSSFPQGPYGTREEQLGLSVRIDGFEQWNQVLSTMENTMDFTQAQNALSDSQKAVKDWLQANAWQYGWIVRYPENRQDQTGVPWQPFLIRYVGEENARLMHEQNLTLNELHAQKEAENES